MAGSDSNASSSLEDLLAEYVERRDLGEDLDPERFARERPDAPPGLREALADLDGAADLFPGSFDDLPARIAGYRVLGEIGRGGMGRVLRVRREGDPASPPVALKLLHVGLEASGRALERFHREGEALVRIEHPGIVRVLDRGVVGRSPFLVMELVRGRSLAALLREARERREEAGTDPDARAEVDLPGAGDRFDRAARVVARVARAVGAAHREGVLHRDIKPSNVLLEADGQPVLIDFGLVRSEHLSTLTGTGDTLGTPSYMAPEQARGERVDPRSDVYSLGALLYELLTLEPTRGGTDSLAALRDAGSRPIRSPRALDPSIPRGLALVCRRALAFARRWRYRTAEELAADLEAWLEGGELLARAPGPAERALDTWLLHRRAVLSVAAAIVVAPSVAWFVPRGDPEEAERRAARERGAALAAWLDGELPEAREHALAAARIAPDAWQKDLLVALCEDRLPARSSDRAVQGFLDAERARRAGDARTALRGFEATLNVTPPSALVLLFVGLAAKEAKDWEQAEWALQLVAPHLHDSVTLHSMLGEVYEARGKPEDVVRALETVLLLEPGAGAAWRGLVPARYAIGDGAGGLEAAARTLELTGDDAWVRGVAERLAREGRGAEARELALLVDRRRED